MLNPPATICIELVSWVNDLAQNPAKDAKYQAAICPADTLRDVLQRFSQHHPKLHKSLWSNEDPKEIGPHIEVIVNDAIMGIEKDLHSSIEGIHVVILAGQYIGG